MKKITNKLLKAAVFFTIVLGMTFLFHGAKTVKADDDKILVTKVYVDVTYSTPVIGKSISDNVINYSIVKTVPAGVTGWSSHYNAFEGEWYRYDEHTRKYYPATSGSVFTDTTTKFVNSQYKYALQMNLVNNNYRIDSTTQFIDNKTGEVYSNGSLSTGATFTQLYAMGGEDIYAQRIYISKINFVTGAFVEGANFPTKVTAQCTTEENKTLTKEMDVEWLRYGSAIDAKYGNSGEAVADGEKIQNGYFYSCTFSQAPFDESVYWNDSKTKVLTNGIEREYIFVGEDKEVLTMEVTVPNFYIGKVPVNYYNVKMTLRDGTTATYKIDVTEWYEFSNITDCSAFNNGTLMNSSDVLKKGKYYNCMIESSSAFTNNHITTLTTIYINGRKSENIHGIFCPSPANKTVISGVVNETAGIKLTWNKNSQATDYEVYRKTSTTGWVKIATTTALTYTDKAVKAGTEYSYIVYGMNDGAKGVVSDAKTFARVGTTTITSSKNQTNGVTINWKATTAATKYMVYRRTVGNGWVTGWTWLKDVYSATTTLDKTAEDGKTYDYLIIPYKGSYKGVKSEIYRHVKVSTPKVTVAKVSNGIKISYGKIANTTKYQVFRKTIGNGWETGWTWLKDTTSLSYTDTTAKAGKTYVYAVKALTPNGQSAVGTSVQIKR